MKKDNSFDPFAPPYNENLYVSELKDEESNENFVILVGRHILRHFNRVLTMKFRPAEQILCRSTALPNGHKR